MALQDAPGSAGRLYVEGTGVPDRQHPHRRPPSSTARRNAFGRNGWLFAAALLVNLLVLGAAVVQVTEAVQRSAASDRDAEEAADIRRLGEDLLLDLVDAETGQRGYLLTGDPAFLEPYTTSLPTVAGRLAALRAETPTSDVRLADSISDLAEAKLSELGSTIEAFDSLGAAAARDQVAEGMGKGLMDDLRVEVDVLVESAEERAQSSAAASAAEQRTARVVSLATALFVGVNLVAMLVLLFQRGSWEREREELMQELETLATRDPLTGLLNRRVLQQRIEHAVTVALADGGDVAVAYLDLDGFKPVNDLLGHHTGDAVLVEVSRRLTTVVRGSDTLARAGGDEFVVVMADFPTDGSPKSVLDRLHAATTLSVPAPGCADETPLVLSVTASIGLVTLRELSADDIEGQDAETVASRLMAHADQVMYDVKLGRVAGQPPGARPGVRHDAVVSGEG